MVMEEVTVEGMCSGGYDGRWSIESCLWCSGSKILMVIVVVEKVIVNGEDFGGGGVDRR